MSNNYVPDESDLLPGELARSADINLRYGNVVAGFDLLPTPVGGGATGFSAALNVGTPTADTHAVTKLFAETTIVTAAEVAALAYIQPYFAASLAATTVLRDEAAASAAAAATSATESETAKVASEAAETNAETAETNAQTAEAGSVAAKNASVSSAAASATSAAESADSATESLASKNAAATSATNSAASAVTSNTAKTSALGAQAAAETAEANAETAESNSTASATAAAASEAAALASKNSAIASATSATSSASSASGSSGTATTKAAESAASAAAALASQNSASGSAATATNQAAISTTKAGDSSSSAAAASTSESNAATSASNAASSATASSNSATASANSATAAAASYDDFDDRYLGDKASDPTLDNDGNALLTGALYFNTTTDVMRVYNGSAWQDTAISPNSPTFTGTVTADGLSLGDNDKATFGNSNDLEIYHDGTSSYIVDNGTGNLQIDANDFRVRKPDGSEAMIHANSDGAVKLFYDGGATPKLATTATGIDVTGTATMDGLTVTTSINAELNLSATGAGVTNNIVLGAGSGLYWNHDDRTTDGLILSTGESFANSYPITMKVGSGNAMKVATNGDISFYEDTGTTPKFFWDASAESLGIGTTTPQTDLEIVRSVAGDVGLLVRNANNTTGDSATLTLSAGSAYPRGSYVKSILTASGGTAAALTFGTNTAYNSAVERMRLDSGGNLLVGKTANNVTTAGVNLNSSGYISSSVSSNPAAYFNRGTSDGNIAVFLKDGTTVGSIASNNGLHLVVGTSAGGGAALRFYGPSGLEAIRPSTIDGTNRSDVIDLGASNARFKDLYLSGTAYVGTSVGIGNTAPQYQLDLNTTGSNTLFGSGISASGSPLNLNLSSWGNSGGRSGIITFTTGSATNGSERVRIDASGNLLVGTTNPDVSFGTSGGSSLNSSGQTHHSSSGTSLILNRTASDGTIAQFRKGGTTVGSIGAVASNININSLSTGRLSSVGVQRLLWDADQLYPATDNVYNLGFPSFRFDDIYATNATIQTSDRNEKQDIAELNTAETAVAVACKGLLRKFRWKDSVAEKGDEARTHFGIIAQDLQAAFEAEGLDAGDYAMFMSDTWTDEETNEEKTRMGVRYSELLAFIIAAL